MSTKYNTLLRTLCSLSFFQQFHIMLSHCRLFARQKTQSTAYINDVDEFSSSFAYYSACYYCFLCHSRTIFVRNGDEATNKTWMNAFQCFTIEIDFAFVISRCIIDELQQFFGINIFFDVWRVMPHTDILSTTTKLKRNRRLFSTDFVFVQLCMKTMSLNYNAWKVQMMQFIAIFVCLLRFTCMIALEMLSRFISSWCLK